MKKKCHSTRSTKERALLPLPKEFRFIDVQKRCISHAPEECGYVALSYVWGNSEYSAKARMGFRHHLVGYTSHELSYKADVLRAFIGILDHSGEQHTYGLPLFDFEQAVLWYPTRSAEQRPTQGYDIFPSWSWTSVDSSVEIPDFKGANTLMPVASWAIAENHRFDEKSDEGSRILPIKPRAVWDSSGQEIEKYRMFSPLPVIALREGLIRPSRELINFRYHDYKFDSWKDKRPKHFWPRYQEFWSYARRVDGYPWFLHQFDRRELEAARICGSILLYTQTVEVRISKEDSTGYIVSDEAGPLGYISFDTRENER